MTRAGVAAARGTIVLSLAVLGFPAIPATPAAEQADGTVTATAAAAGARTCEEDRSTGEPPTYTVRFDPKDSGPDGSAFARAKSRALRYCEQRPCTVDGHTEPRKPSVYGIGSILRGRLIVGFNCVLGDGSAATPPADVSYPLDRPSDIDWAAAKAREHCAPARAKPELADLLMKDGKLVAVFSCGL